jgi:hypothetical protein
MEVPKDAERTIGKARFLELYERTKHLLTRIHGKWDPVTRTWKILKYGITGYIASYLYKKDGKKYIHKIPDHPDRFVCSICGAPRVCIGAPHTYKRAWMIERLFIIGDIGEYDMYAYLIVNHNGFQLAYISPNKTQVLNGDLILQDGKLVMVERAKKTDACHAFLNIEITQADLDSYDPERLDTYLFEIFDENNYRQFMDAVSFAYSIVCTRKCYFICANKTVKKILTYIIKALFGSLYFDKIYNCASNSPQLTIRQSNSNSWWSGYHYSSKLSYTHGGTTFYMGSIPIDRYMDSKSIIYARDIDSIESVPRSALVKLALDLAFYPCQHPEFIRYNR